MLKLYRNSWAEYADADLGRDGAEWSWMVGEWFWLDRGDEVELKDDEVDEEDEEDGFGLMKATCFLFFKFKYQI
jgi:hypothetical protein